MSDVGVQDLGFRVWSFMFWKEMSSAGRPPGWHCKTQKTLEKNAVNHNISGQHPRPGRNYIASGPLFKSTSIYWCHEAPTSHQGDGLGICQAKLATLLLVDLADGKENASPIWQIYINLPWIKHHFTIVCHSFLGVESFCLGQTNDKWMDICIPDERN